MWKKANPEFLAPGRSPRTARRIKHVFRQREKLQSWLERALARASATAELRAKVEQAWKDHTSAQAEKQRQREAQRLTPEQEALADRLLQEFADMAMQVAKPVHDKWSTGEWARRFSLSSAVVELKKVEQQLDKLPIEQVRAFERHERRTEEDRLNLQLRRAGAGLPTESYRPGGRGRYHSSSPIHGQEDPMRVVPSWIGPGPVL